MNIKICENGHYYNGNRYKCCPYCEEQQMVSQGKLKKEKQGNVVEEEHVDIQQEVQQVESNKAVKVKKAEKKKYSEKEIRKDYAKLTKLLIEWNMSITTMESATAGQIASLITDTEGASAIFKGASITYSNETKIMQGVSAEVIHKYTVYSKETAEAMATACANMYGADIGIGVTGTMGNTDPDNADASVPGQVYFAISLKGSVRSYVVEIPQQPSRLMYKLAVAKEVYDVLMGLFE